MKSLHVLGRYALGLGLCLIALGGCRAAMGQIDGGQIDPIKSPYQFSSIGIARGQTARLNVFYDDVEGSCLSGGSCQPASSYDVDLSFVDQDGNTVAANTQTLIQGKGGTLNYVPTSFQSDGRATVRAVVSPHADPNGFIPCLTPSVEILDLNTGQTNLLHPGAITGFNPQPEPPGHFDFGLFQVIKGQTARVSAAFVMLPNGFPPGPCRLTLSFYSGDGQLLSQSAQTVDFGHTAIFDFPTTSFVPTQRKRIRASVDVEPMGGGLTPSFIPCIMPALEIFAADTGKGSIYYPGAMIGSSY